VIDETAARPAATAWLTDSADSSVPPTTAPQSAFRTALAGLIGNVIEWFDFAVYGYFATDIGRQFFPQSSPTAQQLLAFTVFALGFVARPIGGVALGVIGDRIGRRTLLTISVAVMGASRWPSACFRPSSTLAWRRRCCWSSCD
jgi:MHS family proline/betaine transporter-like MFS transporter